MKISIGLFNALTLEDDFIPLLICRPHNQQRDLFITARDEYIINGSVWVHFRLIEMVHSSPECEVNTTKQELLES